VLVPDRAAQETWEHRLRGLALILSYYLLKHRKTALGFWTLDVQNIDLDSSKEWRERGRLLYHRPLLFSH
jgi:hypothetical protein